MKFLFYTHTNFYSRGLILFLALVLSGCTPITGTNGVYNGDYLQGTIQTNHGQLPENATVYISISQSKATGEKEYTLHEYSIVTQTQSPAIPFRLQLPSALILSSQPFNISVRVEKDRELIMMSNKLTPFLRQPGEKLILTVNNS